MTLKLAQVAAIIRYEFKMQYRGRGIPAFILSLISISVIFGIFFTPEMTKNAPTPTDRLNTANGFSIGPAYILLILVLPAFVSDIIPKDRQLGISEFLESYPLSRGTYLLGKLASAWITVLVGLVSVVIFNSIWWWLFLGVFDLGAVISFLSLGIIPLTVANLGLPVLLAAGQPTARRGIFAGIAFVIFCLFCLMAAGREMAFLDTFNPARPAIFYYLAVKHLDRGTAQVSYPFPATIEGVWLTILFGFIELALVWLAVWFWYRWRDAR